MAVPFFGIKMKKDGGVKELLRRRKRIATHMFNLGKNGPLLKGDYGR